MKNKLDPLNSKYNKTQELARGGKNGKANF